MWKLFFEIKVDFKVDLKSRLNFKSCFKNQGFFFKMCQYPLFPAGGILEGSIDLLIRNTIYKVA